MLVIPRQRTELGREMGAEIPRAEDSSVLGSLGADTWGSAGKEVTDVLRTEDQGSMVLCGRTVPRSS